MSFGPSKSFIEGLAYSYFPEWEGRGFDDFDLVDCGHSIVIKAYSKGTEMDERVIKSATFSEKSPVYHTARGPSKQSVDKLVSLNKALNLLTAVGMTSLILVGILLVNLLKGG